ncbi:hypothetical protein [Roseibium polysiphoniae]|uniref:DUF2029 domain-containing protein n=1 Tax=Roseibium polysiphoniae TaxID=2571221 RepID=A0ABR9CCT6_9HYPH|nr:hypothetical protein [Roseibium polysiphoniae]MBD8877711.1 hypothetical protein [Roseibium polysiphoniae]
MRAAIEPDPERPVTPAARLLETCFLTIYSGTCRLYRPLRHVIGALVLTVFALMVAAVVQIYPVSNWDMVAYTASVLESDISDPIELHDRSYALLKENVSEGEFQALTGDREYRIRQFEDPDAFATMLGFYRLKLGYVETARALSAFMDPVKSLRMISMLSAVAVAGVLLVWLARHGALMYGPIVVAMLIIADFGGSAALLSPDLYASIFLLLAGFLYIERQDLAAAASLIAALFIRPDHLAFIGVFFVFALIYGPGRWVMTATFVLSALAYAFVLKGESHPGWWIHLWFTHVEYVPTLEGFDPPMSPVIYLQMLVRSTVRSLMSNTWLAALLALVIFFAKVIKPAQMADRARILLYAIFTSICAKYLVFPHYETRFYFPYLIAMGTILLIAWHQQDKTASRSNPA